eukprot:TRINITY_DN129_c0_g1_i8.p2 TRINITY_DN129_c0_g1~~TRINITY_DN129_c0_g1_i8.p2  ORF type:complete len:139 (+),score=36.57 TRINITY_DN129_c0_g1_i8:338-754(+)
MCRPTKPRFDSTMRMVTWKAEAFDSPLYVRMNLITNTAGIQNLRSVIREPAVQVFDPRSLGVSWTNVYGVETANNYTQFSGGLFSGAQATIRFDKLYLRMNLISTGSGIQNLRSVIREPAIQMFDPRSLGNVYTQRYA